MGTNTRPFSAALMALATVGATLVVALSAAPAQAGWSDVGGITDYRMCRAVTPSGKGWVFRSVVRKPEDTEDARAGVRLFDDGQARQKWSSGWLEDDETARGRVRIQRSRGVRLHVTQEAGDRDSAVGTALEVAVLRPRAIRHCDHWH